MVNTQADEHAGGVGSGGGVGGGGGGGGGVGVGVGARACCMQAEIGAKQWQVAG